MKRTLTFALAVLFLLVATVAFAHVAGQKICIDPGHGGSDPGAVGQGLYEDNINLIIGNKMHTKLDTDGATAISTRTTDVYVSLAGRVAISNNNACNRFISTHCNAFNGAAYGTETYCYGSGSANSFDLRNKVNPEIVSHMGTTNRGVKTASFYVLVYTNAPAILGEVAFIDNAGDAAKLGNATYQDYAARAYLHGTQSHYGEAPHGT
jgi:N-acetylmuramoyl-L-alanine amidase